MPVIETKGALSAQGFGEFAKTTAPVYIEDVMSVWLYTGNGSTQTITNGIDLAGEGGLVWTKQRSTGISAHWLFDTARGANSILYSDTTDAATNTAPNPYLSFGSSGFSLLRSASDFNQNGSTYASWTFRKAPKFFDVVTYTGNGTTQNIAHSLGSTPGCIIVKSTNNTFSWGVYHRSYPNGYLFLNSTNAGDTANAQNMWGNNSTVVAPTSTQFTVGSFGTVNSSGTTYVAYLFAHDAGGFGLTGTDNVISCGSLSGAGTTVNLGYEPQWILAKRTDTTGNWYIDDNMRGWPAAPGNDNPLLANSSAAEPTGYAGFANITSTGFTNNFNGDYIYIAIRRGPMKTPTSGTSVFSPNVVASDLNGATTGFPVDMLFELTTGVDSKYSFSRLTGIDFFRTSATTSGSGADANWYRSNTGIGSGGMGVTGAAAVYESFRRAPGFFDVVVYTGTGANRTVTHNLGVAPELMLIRRTTTSDWWVYDAATGNTKYQVLNLQDAPATSATAWNNTTPTSSVFTVGTGLPVNQSGVSCMAYLFATCPGVSKVGSYTGTGALQTVNCGFTGGARFVLIKRTDSTGDWYVYDSARGISSGNDPYLLMNSTAAEVTGTNYVDTASTGFQVTAAAPAGLNANGGTFVFLAVA